MFLNVAFAASLLLVWEVSADGQATRKLYPASFVAMVTALVFLGGVGLMAVESKMHRPVPLRRYLVATGLLCILWVGVTLAVADRLVISWPYPADKAVSGHAAQPSNR